MFAVYLRHVAVTVVVDQEGHVVNLILDHVILFLPFEILGSQTQRHFRYYRNTHSVLSNSRSGGVLMGIVLTCDLAQNMKMSATMLNNFSASGLGSRSHLALKPADKTTSIKLLIIKQCVVYVYSRTIAGILIRKLVNVQTGK